MDVVNNKIETYIRNGSEVEFEEAEKAYVKVARYYPHLVRTYMPFPQSYKARKKAVINVQNKRDNECLKWLLRAALFPAPKGKNPCRTSSNSTKNGINYS